MLAWWMRSANRRHAEMIPMNEFLRDLGIGQQVPKDRQRHRLKPLANPGIRLLVRKCTYAIAPAE
jgi:hypothetical protein